MFWPTSLAINPIDNTVYILDDDVVYRISHENRVDVMLGIPESCVLSKDFKSYNFVQLKNAIDMDFNSEGDLYILENDKKQLKQIRILKSTGDTEVYFGGYGILSFIEKVNSKPSFLILFL